jgi:hypothetical protein
VATAGEFYSLVETAAQVVAADAELIMVQSPVCDSLGDSYKWLYIYESETTGEQYEFWYKNGELIQQDSVTIPWEIPEDPNPITIQWIDSDSAMLLANQQGGSAFMQSNEMQTIDMRVVQETDGWLRWLITYWAEGANLNVTIDAEIQ